MTNFNLKKFTFLLTVDEKDLKLDKLVENNDGSTVSYTSYFTEMGWKLKKEFHITIIGYKNGEKIKSALSDKPILKRWIAKRKIQVLVEEIHWSYAVSNYPYEIEKKTWGVVTKESIVKVATVEGLEEFYSELNKILGTNLNLPFTHVTLFTKGSDPTSEHGIAIDSDREWFELNPRRLSLPW